MHVAKLNLQISISCSLIYSLSLLVNKLIFIYDFSSGLTDYRYTNPTIYFPVLIIFPLTIVWSHKRYFDKAVKPAFRDVVMISLLIIFMTYSLGYLIDLVSYKFYFETRLPPLTTGKGIIGLIDSFVRPGAPSFSPVSVLIILPFRTLWWALSSGDLTAALLVLVYEKIFYLLLILYIESVFFLFKRHHQNPWFSLVPVLNNWILLKIAGKPAWWNFMIYVPIVRYFILYQVNVTLAADAGKNRTFAIGMTFIPSIFYGYLYLNDKRAL